MSEEVWEVFRQERKGQPFQHAGSVEAPDAAFADAWAREQYGRRGESEALWLVPRTSIHAITDWAELKSVVTGHGPRSQERLAFRARFLEQEKWVRDAIAA